MTSTDKLVIGELDKIQELPEFQRGMDSLIDAAKKRAEEIWSGYTYGGMFPGAKQYGMTSALPKFFGSSTTHLKTFRQNLGSANAWQSIFDLTVQEDVIIGMMGIAITSPTVTITELRAEISDKKYPRVNIEEMQSYDKPAVIFKQGLIGVEEEAFKLRGYKTAAGYQRVVPIGSFVLFKRKDLVITE